MAFVPEMGIFISRFGGVVLIKTSNNVQNIFKISLSGKVKALVLGKEKNISPKKRK